MGRKSDREEIDGGGNGGRKKTAVVVAGRAVALWEPDLLGS